MVRLTFLLIVLASLTIVPSVGYAQEPLTQTYTSPGGTLTLNYPDGWVMMQPPVPVLGIYLGNSLGALSLLVLAEFEGADMSDAGNLGIAIAVEQTSRVQGREADQAVQSQVIINGKPATRFDHSDVVFDDMRLVVNFDHDLSLVIAARSNAGQISQFEPTVLAIAESIRFVEPLHTPQNVIPSPQTSLTETYTLTDGTLAFDYPSGWTVTTNAAIDSVDLLNNPISLDRYLLFDIIDPGFLMISISSTPGDFPSQSGTEKPLTIAGRRTLRTVSEPQRDDETTTIYYFIEAGNDFGWQIFARVRTEELQQAEPLILAIAETIRDPNAPAINSGENISKQTTLLKATIELRVRDCPSISCSQLGTIGDINQDYAVIGQSGSGMWLQIEFEGNPGWVCKQYTTVANSNLEMPFTGDISEDCGGNKVPTLDNELQNSNPTFSRPLYTTSPRINGADVRIVQSRLQELGYSPGPIDGYYGPLTEAAVRAFQADKNLSVDGVVNEVTWNELFDIPIEEVRSTESNDVSLTSQPASTVSASTSANGVIAYVAPDRGNAITLLNSQTLQPTDISNALTTSNVRTIKFSPNGQHLAYTTLSEQGSSLFVIDMNAPSRSRMLVELFGGQYDWSGDSTRLVYSQAFDVTDSSAPQGLWIVDVITGDKQVLIRPISQASLSFPDWSPDGKFIRFVEVDSTVVGDYIVVRSDGTLLSPAASIRYRVGSDWSPDGTRFVFDDDDGYEFGNRSLYLVNRDGTGQRLLYTQAGFSSTSPIWSPDGQYIAFWKRNDESGQSSTWIINVDTGVPLEIPRSGNSRPIAWSPDSTRLITNGEFGTLLHSINGGEPVLLGAGYEVSWQPVVATSAVQECDLRSVNVNYSIANFAVLGKVVGENPCETVILEITNRRSHWTNLTVTPVGRVTISPAGGNNNFYARYKILGPGATVSYQATFSGLGQTVIVSVDATTNSGQGARIMNFVQALVDIVTLRYPGVNADLAFDILVEQYPNIINTFGTLEYLDAATRDLFSFPPNFLGFIDHMMRAAQEGEFTRLASTLTDLGFDLSVEAFKEVFEEPGRILGAIEVIVRNYNTAFWALILQPVGFIVFEAR